MKKLTFIEHQQYDSHLLSTFSFNPYNYPVRLPMLAPFYR